MQQATTNSDKGDHDILETSSACHGLMMSLAMVLHAAMYKCEPADDQCGAADGACDTTGENGILMGKKTHKHTHKLKKITHN